MKKIFKNLSFILITILSIGLFTYKSKINIFAEITDIGDMRIGSVYKNGDVITYNGAFNFCNIDPNASDCEEYNYGFYIEYLREDDTTIRYVKNDGPYDWSTGEYHNVQMVIQDNYSEYWQLKKVSYASGTYLNFSPFYYTAPEFNVECNPNKIQTSEYSLCTIKTKTKYPLESVSFNLDINDFEIIEIKAGDYFEKISVNNNVYTTKTKENINNLEEEIILATIELKTKENKKIDIENNVKITNINYKDLLETNTISELSTTINQEKDENYVTPSDDKETNEGKTITPDNPKTGDNSYLILYGILVLVISVTLFLIVNKKSNYNV